MGVALLVLLPVLYTDTTDAWRLRTRRERLRIVTAGVRAELYLALIATFLWNVLPDGTLRSAAFFVATTSWVTSVLINISPFMRFDGYYALSDLLGIENLQPRAFAVGRWQLRRLLWGFDAPLPEPMPRSRLRLLTLYAWGTWLYRFFLFLGIALLVYHLFFKLLGIMLFAVEVAWFVLLPILGEMRTWWRQRGSLRLSPARLLFWTLCIGALLWLLVPHPTSINVPAILRASQTQVVFAPEPAQLQQVLVATGDSVSAGQLLAELRSDELEFNLRQVREQLTDAQTQLGRSAASSRDKAQRAITEQEISRLEQRLRGLLQRQERLRLRAPFDAQVTQMEQLQAGAWVNEEQPLMQLVAPDAYRVEGFVSEHDLSLIAAAQPGRFIADRGDLKALQVSVMDVDIGAVHDLPYPELSSQYGGSIAVRPQQDGRLSPENAQYRVNFTLNEHGELPLKRLPGVVQLQSRSHSWLWRELKLLAAPLIRESGF